MNPSLRCVCSRLFGLAFVMTSLSSSSCLVQAFPVPTPSNGRIATTSTRSTVQSPNGREVFSRNFATGETWALSAQPNDDDTNVPLLTLSESDQGVVGAVGTVAALVVFGSEYVLATTGCGLPAGPAGLFGLAEGLSYLTVVALVAYSVVTKIRTGSGLPAGPAGLLGAAEGLSFLAIAVGIVVLVLQVTNYGYIPNAVPMEGGMCS